MSLEVSYNGEALVFLGRENIHCLMIYKLVYLKKHVCDTELVKLTEFIRIKYGAVKKSESVLDVKLLCLRNLS